MGRTIGRSCPSASCHLYRSLFERCKSVHLAKSVVCRPIAEPFCHEAATAAADANENHGKRIDQIDVCMYVSMRMYLCALLNIPFAIRLTTVYVRVDV